MAKNSYSEQSSVVGENQAIIDLMSDRFKVEKVEVGDGSKFLTFLVTPDGMHHDMTEKIAVLQDKPGRRTGRLQVADLSSFLALVGRWKTDDSIIWSDRQAGAFTATFEDHPEGADPSQAAWRDFSVTWNLAQGEAFRKCNEFEGRWHSQTDIALFLEERIGDVVEPGAVKGLLNEQTQRIVELMGSNLATASELLTLSKGMTINVDSRMSTIENLDNGEAHIFYEENHRDASGNKIKVPNAFVIALQIYDGAPPVAALVRLRYRAREGTVKWFLELHDKQKLVDFAFDDLSQKVSEAGVLLVRKG